MNWRALVAGGVFIALLVVAVLIARPQRPGEAETPPPARQPAPEVVAAPIAPLTRADLIDAAARAADAHALGRPGSAEDRDLAGRQFTLRVPFGCGGPAAADSEAPMRWSYDAAEETLRVSVTPRVWTDAAPVRAAAAGVDFEAAEGFWIERPWLRSGDCPAAPQPAAEAAPPADAAEGEDEETVTSSAPGDVALPAPPRETLALVELFAPDSRRAARRNGRPYTVVTKVAPGEIDLSQGLRVVVSGRLAPLSNGSPIACSGFDIDERPLCLIRAEIDRVTITDSSGRRVLGEWGA